MFTWTSLSTVDKLLYTNNDSLEPTFNLVTVLLKTLLKSALAGLPPCSDWLYLYFYSSKMH